MLASLFSWLDGWPHICRVFPKSSDLVDGLIVFVFAFLILYDRCNFSMLIKALPFAKLARFCSQKIWNLDQASEGI